MFSMQRSHFQAFKKLETDVLDKSEFSLESLEQTSKTAEFVRVMEVALILKSLFVLPF